VTAKLVVLPYWIPSFWFGSIDAYPRVRSIEHPCDVRGKVHRGGHGTSTWDSLPVTRHIFDSSVFVASEGCLEAAMGNSVRLDASRRVVWDIELGRGAVVS
jgi:hypothetical protein